jgi:hypothetical protein
MSARPVFVRQRVEVAFYGDGTLEQPDTVQMTVDLTEAQQIVDRLGANAFMVLFHLVSLAEVDRTGRLHVTRSPTEISAALNGPALQRGFGIDAVRDSLKLLVQDRLVARDGARDGNGRSVRQGYWITPELVALPGGAELEATDPNRRWPTALASVRSEPAPALAPAPNGAPDGGRAALPSPAAQLPDRVPGGPEGPSGGTTSPSGMPAPAYPDVAAIPTSGYPDVVTGSTSGYPDVVTGSTSGYPDVVADQAQRVEPGSGHPDVGLPEAVMSDLSDVETDSRALAAAMTPAMVAALARELRELGFDGPDSRRVVRACGIPACVLAWTGWVANEVKSNPGRISSPGAYLRRMLTPEPGGLAKWPPSYADVAGRPTDVVLDNGRPRLLAPAPTPGGVPLPTVKALHDVIDNLPDPTYERVCEQVQSEQRRVSTAEPDLDNAMVYRQAAQRVLSGLGLLSQTG